MEKSEKLLFLYEKQLDSFNRRREYEWKITLIFWTGAIGSTGFLVNKLNLEHSCMEQWYIFNIMMGVFVLWVLFVFLWLSGIWVANEKDKRWAKFYRKQIEAEINMEESSIKEPEKPYRWDFIGDWSMQFQALFSLALLILIWYMLYNLPSA